MRKKQWKKWVASGILFSTGLWAMPAEASVLAGPYHLTKDTVLSAPQGYHYTGENGKGTQTYSVLSSSGTGQAVTADAGTTVSIKNEYPYSASSDQPSWTYGAAAFNGGSVTLDKVSLQGIFWAGIYTMGGGTITVGDDAYIDTWQGSQTNAAMTYQSYGVRNDGGTITMGDNAYIKAPGVGIWMTSADSRVKAGNGLTIDTSQIADGDGIFISAGQAEAGSGTSITSSGRGIFVYTANASAVVGDGLSIKMIMNGNVKNPAAGILAYNGGKVTAGKNMTVESDGYALYSTGSGSLITAGDGAVLQGNTLYTGNSDYIAAVRAANNGQILLGSAEITQAGTLDTASAISATGGGSVKGTGVYQINGNLKSGSGGAIDLTMNAGSVMTGKTLLNDSSSAINLDMTDSAWYVTGNSALTDLESNDSLIDMTADGGAYSTLTMAGLTGDNGIFKLDINANALNENDRIYVTGTFSGTQWLDLNNTTGNNKTVGQEAAGTVLASVGNNEGTFKAVDGEGTLYWKRYILDTEESGTDGYTTDWYLKAVENVDPDDKPTATVTGVSASGLSSYYVWRDNEQMIQRMGDLRHNGDKEKGIWFRMKGTKVGRNGVNGFDTEYTQFQLGYDKKTVETADYVRYGGIAASYVKGNTEYTDGRGDIREKSVTLYQTQMGNKGHYWDMLFRAGWLGGNFSVYDSQNNRIHGDYGNRGFQFSLEYGRKKILSSSGWYAEPQMQMTLGRLMGDSYLLTNGVQVRQKNADSALGRIGLQIGKDIDGDTHVYAKINLLHEFAGSWTSFMTDGTDSLYDKMGLSDTWIEYGMGADIRLGEYNRMYFDISKSAGGDFKKKWQWIIGSRWMF